MKEFRYKLSTAIHTPVSLNYTINKVLGNLYVHKFHLTNQCHICSFRYEVWDDGYTTKDGYISYLHKQKYGNAPKNIYLIIDRHQIRMNRQQVHIHL